jgi:hypothetical protein
MLDAESLDHCLDASGQQLLIVGTSDGGVLVFGYHNGGWQRKAGAMVRVSNIWPGRAWGWLLAYLLLCVSWLGMAGVHDRT